MAQSATAMLAGLGLSEEGLQTALDIKQSYHRGDPVCMPGDDARILLPEYLVNRDLQLSSVDDPLPLAMLATRDPEAPMAVAATSRLSPLGKKNKLISGVVQIVGETSKHPLVRECVSLLTDPPPVNWSTVYFNERRIKDGDEATQTGRDCLEAAAG